MTDLSVIVASYETPDLLDACLASLARARDEAPGLALEVIVVDNGSRDDSLERARRAAIAPRLVAGLENRGFAAAMNRGLRIARGRHALLLNSDAEVDGTLLAAAVAQLDADPQIAVLGPALRHPDGRPQRSVHRWPSLWTELLGERGVTAWADRGLAGRIAAAARSDGLVDVPAVRGAVFFLGGEAREQLGPLDEGYFFFLEETDYCRRAHAAGRRVVFAPGLVARHGLGASSKARAPLAARIEYHRALDRFLRRHRGEAVARVARTWRALRQGVALPFQALLALRPGSPSRRRTRRARVAERCGLVLWHLRGRPDHPGFAEALALRASAPGGDGGGTRTEKREADAHGEG